MIERCRAFTHAGRPCRNRAVRDSDPPRCGAHGGGRRPAGAPYGNRNAQIHGHCARERPVPRSVESLVADLAAHQLFLAALLPEPGRCETIPTVPVPALAQLLALHARSGALVGRVLGELDALSPAAVARLVAAWEAALAELAGVEGSRRAER